MSTPALKMAGYAAEQLRWAELNEEWAYMMALLRVLREMGARVVMLPDARYRWRNDYIVQFRQEDSLPGVYWKDLRDP
jgi:hypothetical protein